MSATDPIVLAPQSRETRLLGRPPTVWTAALLYLFGGATCLFADVFPISAGQPVALDLAIGVFSCVVALALWLGGSRVPQAGLHLCMAVGTLAISTIVARAVTAGGVMLTAFAYPWIAVYTAHFFSRREMLMHLLLVSVSFGVALLLNDLPNLAIDWMIVSGTVFTTGLVLGNLSESLRAQAVTDPLTGLLNRNGFFAAAARERAIADRSGAPLSVAVIDLDDFKAVNDRFGHAAGDRLLVELGNSWSSRLRAGDILARYGGDEFVLLLPATTPTVTQAVLDRLQDPDIQARWSAGISEWVAEESLDDCLARADHELYAIKSSRARDPHSARLHVAWAADR